MLSQMCYDKSTRFACPRMSDIKDWCSKLSVSECYLVEGNQVQFYKNLEMQTPN